MSQDAKRSTGLVGYDPTSGVEGICRRKSGSLDAPRGNNVGIVVLGNPDVD